MTLLNFYNYSAVDWRLQDCDHNFPAHKINNCDVTCNFQSKFVCAIYKSKQMVRAMAYNKLQQLERQLCTKNSKEFELQMGL